MAGLTYGPIKLLDVVTREYSQKAVLNGTDYLYTEHMLTGTATVHPRLVEDSLAGGQYVTGVDAVAGMALAFLQPRQALKFEVGIVPFEAMAYTDDVQSGPEGMFFDAVQVIGAKTVVVSFGIKWYTISAGDTDCPPITSNRWVMSHSYDDQFRLTIVTKGLATFRRDALLLYGTNPDFYRKWIMIPIPVGYRRILGPIEMAQDGLAISYTTQDSQIIMESTSDQIAHMKVMCSAVSVAPGLHEIGRDAAVGLAGLLGGMGLAAGRAAAGAADRQNQRGGGPGKAPGPWQVAPGRALFGAFGLGAAGLIGAGIAIYDRLPRTVVAVKVMAIAVPTAHISSAYNACVAVMKAKLANPFKRQGLPFISLTGASTQLEAEVDHEERAVLLSCTYSLPPSFDPLLNLVKDPGGAGAALENPPQSLDDATAMFLVHEELYRDSEKDELGDFDREILYGDAKLNQIRKGPGQGDEDRLGYLGVDVMQVLVAQALQPAAPDGMTYNPPQAPDVTSEPELIDPEGRTL